MSVTQFAAAAKNVVFWISNLSMFLSLMPSLFGFSLFLCPPQSFIIQQLGSSSLAFSLSHPYREFSTVVEFSTNMVFFPYLTMRREGGYCDLITKGRDSHYFIWAAAHLPTYHGTQCSLEASFKNHCLTRIFFKLMCLQELQTCGYKPRPPWWEHGKTVYSEFAIARESAIIICVCQRLKVS